MKYLQKNLKSILIAITLMVSACSDFGNVFEKRANKADDEAKATYTIGGTVSGLAGTLVLQSNSGDDLTVTANGKFTFATPVEENNTYDVTIKVNPNGQVCSLNFAAGVASANVTNVAVACAMDNTWVQDAYLKASNSKSGQYFGWSVAISGSTIVVGALNERSNQTTVTNTDGAASSDTSLSNAGAVYVFKREANGDWVQDAYLKASIQRRISILATPLLFLAPRLWWGQVTKNLIKRR